MGALIEATAEYVAEPPLLIFDRVKDYPAGYRVTGLLLSSIQRGALAWGLPMDAPKLDLARMATEKLRGIVPLPPRVVSTGSVMENVQQDAAVDLCQFPAPYFHESDGGRYLGSGCVVIQKDPDSHFVNLGAYRMQLHGPQLLGLWTSPGQHGQTIAKKYWVRGEACPVAATFGQDPLTFMAASTKLPYGQSEMDYVGGLRSRPLDVVSGELTALPIPAHAEIAIEGEIPPPSEEAVAEGPYGEWTGYYSGGTRGTGEDQPVIRVKRLYFRNSPILQDESPLWPGARQWELRIGSGSLWDQLERAGVQDIAGVWQHNRFFVVVAIRQRYPGHAKQAGHAANVCAEGARNGRWVIVVDEDIDPSNMSEVIWAMQTRVDPARDIELVDGCWSTPLDPRMPPEKKVSGDFTNSRAIVYAVRPYVWKDKFPEVSRTSRERRNAVIEKYRGVLPFPLSL
jgi:4-hydroxy-3-polyprenylbenzoate decarboxylase